ncbi:KilA-like protein [Nostoc sp. HK-01]|nr:KilA-like protein [Nostoc sp. HK-01]
MGEFSHLKLLNATKYFIMTLTKISYELYGIIVQQRICDGYVNATQLCKAHKEITGEEKLPKYWLILESTKDILIKLSEIVSMPVESLVEVTQGKYGGTWLHPRLVVRFTMWLNNDFSLQVEDWVQKWFSAEQKPVQISFSELNSLMGLLDTAIQAAEMTHTILHGLTYFLNRARENLETIRSLEDAETIVNNSIYQQQIEKAENRLYNLADRVEKLRLMNSSQKNEVIHTINLDINDYQKSKESVLDICSQTHKSKILDFLSIQPDIASNGTAPVLFEFNQNILTIFYTKLNAQIKSILNGIDNHIQDSIIIDYCYLNSQILNVNNKNISLEIQQGKLCLNIDNGSYVETVVIPPVDATDFIPWDVDDFIADDVLAEIDETAVRQLRFKAIFNKTHISNENLYWDALVYLNHIQFIHETANVVCSCMVPLKQNINRRDCFRFDIHENVIEIANSFKYRKMTIMLDYGIKKALINLDNNVYILTSGIKKEFSGCYGSWTCYGGIHHTKGYFVNKRDFCRALEYFAITGSEYVNLNFQSNRVDIKSADQEVANIITIRYQGTVSRSYCLAATILLNILKLVDADEVCFYIPAIDEISSHELPNLAYIGHLHYINPLHSRYFVWYSIFEAIELSDEVRNSNQVLHEAEAPMEFKPIYWKIKEGKNWDKLSSSHILEAVQEEENQKFCQLQLKIIPPSDQE